MSARHQSVILKEYMDELATLNKCLPDIGK
jgi:hypothetical protein